MLATVIGDLVGSRQADQRWLVQDRLISTLAQINDATDPVQPLTTTVGDEFQGAYSSIPDAVRASLLIRLALRPSIDSRYGLGWGPVEMFAPSGHHVPPQDGPGWWAARDAIVHAKLISQGRTHRHQRTWFESSRVGDRELTGFVNAFLSLRDATIGGLSKRGERILHGLLLEKTQEAIAADEQISPSAVSQQVSRHQLAALAEAHRFLKAAD